MTGRCETLSVGTQCKHCGMFAPAQLAEDCNRPECEYKKGPTMTDKLDRPIIGIENRTPQEVFDIMCDRIRGHRLASTDPLMGEVREAAEPILRYHETGGHEGDWSDEALARLRALLARIEEPKG